MSSQARTTAALKCFFRFLVEEERLLRDPALPLRTPKKPEVLPDVLTMSELERLLAQPERHELWERHFPGKPERTGAGRSGTVVLDRGPWSSRSEGFLTLP